MINKCSFCNFEFVEPLIKKMKAEKLLSPDNELTTQTNMNISRCGKCKKHYSCLNCTNKLKMHYALCKEEPTNIFIFADGDNCNYTKEFDFVLLPKKLGGFVVNVSTIKYCKDYVKYEFYETAFNLYKIFFNNCCFWSKDNTELNRHKITISIGEQICSQILKSLKFNQKEPGFYKFKKIRPNWLKCSYSKRNLEIDLYNDELRLGIEYNGGQHYKFTPIFHKTEADFEKQLQRDQDKIKICNELNIKLVVVPYALNNYSSIETFLKTELKYLLSDDITLTI